MWPSGWRNSVAGAVEAVYRQHRRQPLVCAAALFLLGIVCGYRFGLWPVAAGAVVACGLLAALVSRDGLRRGAIILLVFQLGWSVAAWDLGGRRAESLRIRERVGRHSFVCRVGPEVVRRPLAGESVRFVFQGQRFGTEDGACKVRHLPVEVSWFGARDAAPEAVPRPGEVWRLTGSAKVRKGRNGLPALTVNTGEERSERVREADAGSWTARIERARRQAVRRVTAGIEDWGVVPALNQAMLLGNRYEMPPEMRRVFADSGTIHVFAISGLHIVLVAALLVMAVSLLGVPRPYWVVGVAPLLVFYTVATGARPSAIRACLMAILYFVAPLAGRRPSGVAALAGTALIVHAWQPWLVFDIGSVLSFAVMGGLVFFCRPFCAAARRACRVERLTCRERLYTAGGQRAAARRVRWLKAGVQFLADSFAVSLAAWLASVPLTAHYFGRFTPGGLFANLVITPCSFFIVVAGCLGMAASFVSAWAASCFNHECHLPTCTT